MPDSGVVGRLDRKRQQMSLADLRVEYRRGGLDESRVSADPFDQFAIWFAEARTVAPWEPNAMTLVTATPDGVLSARIVLLKEVDERGASSIPTTRARRDASWSAILAPLLSFIGSSSSAKRGSLGRSRG